MKVMEGVKLAGAITVTAGFAYLTYQGVVSLIDVSRGVDHLRDAVLDLQEYVTNHQQTISHIKRAIIHAQTHLTNHMHLFSLSPDAKELTDVVNNLATADKREITSKIIPHINKVVSAYQGPGNCPIIKLLAPLGGTGLSGLYTLSRIV